MRLRFSSVRTSVSAFGRCSRLGPILKSKILPGGSAGIAGGAGTLRRRNLSSFMIRHSFDWRHTVLLAQPAMGACARKENQRVNRPLNNLVGTERSLCAVAFGIRANSCSAISRSTRRCSDSIRRDMGNPPSWRRTPNARVAAENLRAGGPVLI